MGRLGVFLAVLAVLVAGGCASNSGGASSGDRPADSATCAGPDPFVGGAPDCAPSDAESSPSETNVPGEQDVPGYERAQRQGDRIEEKMVEDGMNRTP
jgi:hypothetical protein